MQANYERLTEAKPQEERCDVQKVFHILQDPSPGITPLAKALLKHIAWALQLLVDVGPLRRF